MKAVENNSKGCEASLENLGGKIKKRDLPCQLVKHLETNKQNQGGNQDSMVLAEEKRKKIDGIIWNQN